MSIHAAKRSILLVDIPHMAIADIAAITARLTCRQCTSKPSGKAAAAPELGYEQVDEANAYREAAFATAVPNKSLRMTLEKPAHQLRKKS